jgi:cysteinyl-tRNA synthetase
MLAENIIPTNEHFHHRFETWDLQQQVRLSEQMAIHSLELDKWVRHPDQSAPPAIHRWMRFFTEAAQWESVPEDIHHPVLESAMSVLHTFQENAQWNDFYHRREIAERLRADREQYQAIMEQKIQEVQAEKEQQRAEKERALAEKEQQRAEKERALAQAAHLRERLRQLGIDPDQL